MADTSLLDFEFDTAAARDAGMTDAAIAEFLAPHAGFDLTAAREKGMADAQVVDFLAPERAPAPKPPKEKPLGVTGQVAAAGKGFARGVASLPGRLLLEQTGALASGAGVGLEGVRGEQETMLRGQIEIMDRIDRGEQIAPADDPMGYADAPADVRRTMRQDTINALAAPDTAIGRVAQSAKKVGGKLLDAGQETREFVERQIPMSQTEEESVGGMVGTLAAEVPAYIGAYATAGVPGVVAYSGMDAFNQTWQDAKKAGADDETAATAATLSGFVQGGLDAVPGVKMARVIPKALREQTFRTAREIVEGAGTMLGFSQLSMLVDNAIAKDSYDPDRPLDQGVLDPKTMAAQAIVGGLPAAAGGVARRYRKTPEEAARPVMEAETVDDAIVAAEREVVDLPVLEETAVQAEEFGGRAEQDQAAVNRLFGGLNDGEVQRAADGVWFYRKDDGKEWQLRPWDGVQREDTIPSALADAQRAHYEQQGVRVVFFENDAAIPFDGAVDPAQPNTIFLSNQPDRNAAQVGAHEIAHAFESTTLPDGTNLGDLLQQQVAAGITSEGRAYAERLFGETAPKREAFPEGDEGASLHADAVTGHLIRELGADIGGEAPKFQTFIPRVIDAVEARYGADTAKSVMQKLIAGIRQAMTTLRQFFFRAEAGAEYGQPPTESQQWVNNLDVIHGTLAQMYAQRFGETAGLTDAPRPEPVVEAPAPTPEPSAPEAPPAAPEGFFEQRPGPGPSAGYADARTRVETLQRWLGELDEQRRATAAGSERARLLRQTEAAILGKVKGVEERLTNAARVRLETVRQQADALLNPTEDSADMARVRQQLQVEQQRMADAAAVGTPSPGMERAVADSQKATGTVPETIPPRVTAVMPERIERQVVEARETTNTEPTDGQKEAGNYLKGRVSFHGLPFVMENPKGSTRSGVDGDGKRWEATLPADYGYLSRTEGADGDQVDAYIGPRADSQRVWVVDQIDPKTGAFDEHKVVLGTRSVTEARIIYQRAFSDRTGPQRIGAITEMSLDQFKAWLQDGDTTAPVGTIKPKAQTQLQKEQAAVKAMAQPKPAPQPVAPEQQVSEFDTKLRAERERLWAEEMPGLKRGKSTNERMVDDAARETVMREEAADAIAWYVDNGLPQDEVFQVARLYRRLDGQTPKEALDLAVDRWITKAEATAARHWGDEDMATYDALKMSGEGDPVLAEAFALLDEHYAGVRKELPGDERIPFDQEPARASEAGSTEDARPAAERPQGAEAGARPRSGSEDTAAPDELGPAFSPRRQGIPAEAAAVATFRSDDGIKAHRDYKAAKAGEQQAAERLVSDLVRPAQLERARLQFKPDTIFLPVIAEEATGHNAIPHALAARYARAVGGELADGIVQANRAFHTGADPMERLISRPVFNGTVEAGRNYVLVDDVSVLGGTLAELAGHIQAGGGRVVGVITLANASRTGNYAPKRTHVSLIERRFGDEIRQRFDVEPGALTGDEAQYLANFRDADALRARIAKAASEREQRLLSKGLRAERPEGGVKPDGETKFSPRLTGENKARTYTPEQQKAFENVFGVERPTVGQRIAEGRRDWQRKLIRETLDPYIGIKRDDPEAYMAGRLANSVSGAQEVFRTRGTLRFDGSTYNWKELNGGVKGLYDGLGAEASDFMRWVVGHRAERLKAEDRENLLTTDDIAAFKALNRGTLAKPYVLPNGKTTTSREAAYTDALKRLDVLNRNIMDLAVDAGLISREKADALIANPFYVPFYRIAEDSGRRGFVGPNLSSALVKQQAFKKLKGGKEKLADPWENALGNWEHMIDAALRNRAAVRILDAAAARGLDAVEKISEADYNAMSRADKANTTWVMLDGERQYYHIAEPMVYKAVSALEALPARGVLMGIGRAFAKVLRYGVTANPFFAIRTAVRDTQNSLAVSEISANPFKNLYDGFSGRDVSGRLQNVARAVAGREMRLTPMTEEAVSAMAGGALMRLGSWNEGFIDQTTVLGTDDKVRTFGRSIGHVLDAWKDVIGSAEDINRMALYRQLRAKGVPHDYASFQGRDLQDFTLKGAAPIVRAITELTPFLNARMQGLYKVGRAAADSDKNIAAAVGGRAMKSLTIRAATVLGAMTALGLALDAIYHDDEDYQKRNEFDRAAYYWFKIGDAQFRIPKGFELAALSSLATDGIEAFFDEEMTGQRVVDNVWRTLGTNLQVQAPAVVQPILDVWTNTSFSGGSIEPRGLERLEPQERYTIGTTMLARGASTAVNAALRSVSTGADGPSPVQIDYLVSAYGAWLATSVLGVADTVVRTALDEPDRPAGDFWAKATQGMIRTDPAPQSRYVNMLYEQGRAIDQAYATYRRLIQEGRGEEARDFAAGRQEELAKYRPFQRIKRVQGNINLQIRTITNSPTLSGEQKRVRIMALQAAKNRAARALFAPEARP